QYFSLGNLLLADINSAQARAAGIPLPYPGFAGSVAQALRPYPQYQGIAQAFAMTGFTTYNSLQLNAQKRLGQGFSFLIAYTISKAFGNGNFGNQGWGSIGLQHNLHRRLAKQLTSLDRPQNLAISYTYELPFGPGKPLANSTNPVLKNLVGN